jgi:Fe-S-cluster containining protein
MDIDLSKALSPIRILSMNAADKSITRRINKHPDITCTKGCSACCSRYLMIYMAEALIIYNHLKLFKKWVDVKKRAKAQLKTILLADPLSWYKLNISCPILDPESKLCLAYKARPVLCSTHFVTSDPVICDPWNAKQGTYRPLDFNDLYMDFRKRIESATLGYNVLSMEMVLPSALLLSERVSIQSGLDLKQALSLIYKEL